MALTDATGTHAPFLVDEVGALVHPVGPVAQSGGYAGKHGALLFFEEETLHHGIYSGRRAGNDTRAAGGGNGQQVGVAHAFTGFGGDALPLGGVVVTLGEVIPRLPVAPGKVGVASLFAGNVGTGFDGGTVDAVEHFVHESEVSLTLPLDTSHGQRMVVAAHTQPDAAVGVVGDAGEGKGIEVEIDDVVESAHHGADNMAHLLVVFEGKVSHGEAGEVTHHEVAGLDGVDHYGFALLGLHFGADGLYFRHVLRDFGAKVGAIDDAAVAVGVGAVDEVAVEGERRARLDGRAEDEAHDVLDGHHAARDAQVVHTLLVAACPLFAVVVFQTIAAHRHHLVGAEHDPLLIEVFGRHAPKEVGIAHSREDVVRLHAVVAVIGAELEELGKVTVPHVEVDRDCPLAHAELVDRHGGVVDELHPADDTAGSPFEATDFSSCGTHLAEVHAHATTKLAHLGKVVDGAVDAVETIGHGVDEAA